MIKHFNNLLYKSSRKSNRFLLLSAVILSASIGTLTGCSGKQASPDEPAVSDSPADSESQTISDTDPSSETSFTNDSENNSSSSHSDSAEDSLSDIDPNEPIDLSDESWSVITLAYIHGLEDGNLAFDTVEWVDVPSDRAKELGIEDEYLDSGFYVHNEATHVETLPLSEDCRCTLLDWADSYKPVETAIKDLPDILKERKDTNIPYELTIQNQKITNIQEHYVP